MVDATAVEERDRPGEVLRQGVEDQHRLARPARAPLRLRQGAGRRPHPLSAGPGQPAAHRARAGLALRRLLPGRPSGVAGEAVGDLGPAVAAGAVPGALLRGAVHGLQHARQPVRELHEGARLQLPGLAQAVRAGVHRRLPEGLRDEPGAVLHRQPLRAVERRHLHGLRRGGVQAHRGRAGQGRRRTAGLLQAVRGVDRRAEARGAGQAAHTGGRPAARRWLEDVPRLTARPGSLV
ncbi:putative Peptidase M48, Ste24p [Streptomyces misionensis JCM 4497]